MISGTEKHGLQRYIGSVVNHAIHLGPDSGQPRL